jgi:hypothetical protein
MKHLQKQFLDKAKGLLREASADEFLGFLTVRKIAGGSATAQFYKAFPGGRDELLKQLWDEALPAESGEGTQVTTETVLRLMQLVSDLKDRKPEALDELRDVALEDFDGYFGSSSDETSDVLCNVLTATARHDRNASGQLLAYYRVLTSEYVGVYSMLLDAIGREPIESLGGVENFAMVITALFDGLAVQARLGQPAEEVLAATLLPIVAALTVPKEGPSPVPAELLYGLAEQGVR